MLFNVKVLGLKKIYDMPGTWQAEDYRKLLIQQEIDDAADLGGSDLFDVLLMALQDLEPEDAADLVLAHKLPARITAGARQNIVQDLVDGQRPWEEHADIRLHARIFASALLLNQAFPRIFTRPYAMELKLRLEGSNSAAREHLSHAPEPAFVTRVLADGMDTNSILERLFDEQLAAHAFPEAAGVIWLSEFSRQDDASAILTVWSSEHWLEAMEDVSEFQSSAYNDRPQPEENDEDDQ